MEIKYTNKIVSIAVSNYGFALKFASARLQDDEELIKSTAI